MPENLQHLVDTAEASIAAAAKLAEADPTRPLYHFRAPAQWMDDPNGIIFHDGLYHMMYSLNPHTAEHRAGMVYKTAVRVWDPKSKDWTGGITVWGHARSRDLVHWEHLPIAIYPSVDKGEHFVWFGCTVINGEGRPMAIYTAVGPDMRPEDTAQQWAALGSPDLIEWTPLPGNPLLGETIHGDEVIGEWRDPFLFQEQGRSFMILGGRLRDDEGGRPVVALYEALDPAYTRWVYRGIVFRHPRRDVPSAECPNLFRLDGKWVLLVSPHAEVEYYVGELDLESYTFRIETQGIADHSRNFYATNVLFDGTGRALMWGAIVGFTGTVGWNGCVSLPRELHVDAEGALTQRPAAELKALRGTHGRMGPTTMESGGIRAVCSLDEAEAVEIHARFERSGDAAFGLRIRHGGGVFELDLDAHGVRAGGLAFEAPRTDGRVDLSLFIDRTVMELFIDERICATRVVPLVNGAAAVEVFCADGSLTGLEVDVWRLEAGGLFTFAEA